MVKRLPVIVILLGLAGPVALAGPEEYSRIARISYLEGNVSFQHPNEVDWSAASINMALQPNDRIYTGDNSRAEVEFDDGSFLRLAEKTDVEILSLSEDLVQVRVLVGLCSLTVQTKLAFEINTPAAAFSTLKKGVFRFDVTEDGSTDAIVRKGRLEAASNSGTQRIDSGELYHVTPGDLGTGLLSRYDSRDSWDEWTDRRSAELTAHTSRRYIPDNVYMGVSELDQYGHWVAVDSYGPAWVPYYVDAGWSPYWVGRWCYRPMWGWTWVSYEPWGWLPYHYGRWHHAGFGWCWLPGPSFGFNFWSPALVRFYYGPSWVSWCPLGPGDYYNVNHYYHNRTNIYQINNIRLMQNRSPEDLANRHVPGAFRTVATHDFVSSGLGTRGRNASIQNAQELWREGRMVTDRLPVQPSASSYAPAPDRPAVRPARDRGLPSIVRTMPATDPVGRDRFVRVTGQPSTTSPVSRVGGRSRAAGSEGAGSGAVSDSGRNGAAAPSGGQVGRGTAAVGTSAPGSIGGRAGNPSKGREVLPGNRTGIERPRATDRDIPRASNPRQESIPRPRTESSPAPRFERQAPQRSEPERSRATERPRPPRNEESSSYQPRTSFGRSDGEREAPQPSVSVWSHVQNRSQAAGTNNSSSYQSRTGGGASYGERSAIAPPAQQAGRVVNGIQGPLSSQQSTWNSGRTVYAAPAAPSLSGRGGWVGGTSGSSAPAVRSSPPASSFPRGEAGIGRPHSH